MKAKKLPIFYRLTLIVVMLTCVVCAGFGFTSAWLTDAASFSTSLTMGKQVSINLYTASSGGTTTSSIGNVSVAPGEINDVNFNPVYIKAGDDTSSCVVRIKLETSGENANLFDISTATIESENNYKWIKKIEDGYYYLTTSDGLNQAVTNLSTIVSGDGNSVKIQVNNVKASKNAINTDGGKSCTITLKVQAIQAANYAYENWSDITWA